MKFIKHIFLSLLLLAVVYGIYQSFSPKDQTDLQVEGFSLQNTKEHVKAIAQAPHYVGSANHAKVRNYISQQLAEIGVQDVHTQQDFSLSADGNLSIPENIIGRLKANTTNQNTKAILLLSHYDSDPHASFGASDAASGVAAILESLRVYLTSKPKFTNDIIICFTDAEELGLNGAELFVNQHPWAKDVGMVLNFEARGSGGPSNMIVETNAGNAQLIKHVQQAGIQHPMANSLMYSVYKLLPNDTDSTVFREQGDTPSLFFAFIDDHFDYHTALDTPERLDDESLLHQADYLLHLLPEFANANLGQLNTTQDQVYVNWANLGLMHYNFNWAWPLLILAFVFWLIVVYFGLQKRQFRLKQVGKSVLVWLLSIILLGVLGTLIYYGIYAIYPHYAEILQGFPYNGHNYIWVVVLLSLGILMGVLKTYKHKFGTAAMLSGFLLVSWLVSLAFTAVLPGANYFVIAVLAGILGLIPYSLDLRFKREISLLFSLPALFFFTPFILFFPVGLGLSMLGLSALFCVLAFGFVQAVLVSKLGTKLSIYTCFIIAVIFAVRGHLSSEFNAERPRPNSLNYQVDLDHKQAFWLSYDSELDSYNSAKLKPELSLNDSLDIDSKYNSKITYKSKAPYVVFPKAEVFIDTLEQTSTTLTYQLTIIPSEQTKRLSLNLDKSINFKTFSINQLTADDLNAKNESYNVFTKRFRSRLFDYFVVNQEPIKIEFSINKNQPLDFKLHQINYNLLADKRLQVKPRQADQMPKPFIVNDAIITTQEILIND